MRRFQALCTLALAGSVPLLVSPGAGAGQEVTVRVAILQEVSSLRVTLLAPCRLTDLKKGTLIAEWPRLAWQEVAAGEAGGIRIGATAAPTNAVVIEPKNEDAVFMVNARPYRGRLILHRMPAGKLLVVDQLDLEDYLMGALTSEVGADWPMEALKAHAVVSRTMAAHRIWIRKNEPFDMTADVSTHLYHGVAAERGSARKAVEETRGQVLTWEGELFSASFHASCGGHTEDPAEIWETKKRIPPLQGVPDPYCKNLKHYRWTLSLSDEEFERLLGAEGAPAGRIREARIVERNRSNRVRAIRLTGDQGTVTLTGRRFRELLGPNRLCSLNFALRLVPGRALFSGFGWGHGVGLCEWGAFGMARAGKTMDEILSFYFPGAQRRPLQGLPGFS